MILCLTHSGDFYTIDLVTKAITDLGYEAVRFNTDRFDHSSVFSYSNKNGNFNTACTIDGQIISLKDVKAVWNRKIWKIQAPKELDPGFATPYLREYNTARNIFFDSLDVPWMNDQKSDEAIASNKIKQLQLAASAGLSVPKTIMTNKKDEIKSFFYDDCKKQMITKMHGALSVSMDGSGAVFPTSQVQEDDLKQLEGLQYCPMIFQEFIQKEYELRIVYINGKFFTGKIATNTQKADWRQEHAGTYTWQAYELPHDIADKLTALMQKANLLFGAIDMIKNKAGEYVFLEVNPKGEWGMLQKDIGHPIAETIAEQLVKMI